VIYIPETFLPLPEFRFFDQCSQRRKTNKKYTGLAIDFTIPTKKGILNFITGHVMPKTAMQKLII